MSQAAPMHTNRQLLPEDSTGSTGVGTRAGQHGMHSSSLALLAIALSWGHAPWSLSYQKYSIFYRKLCVDHNQCLKKMMQVSYIFVAV